MRKILTFLIAVSSPLLLFGQSPGGVVPAAWYKADASGTLFSDAGVTGSANNSTVYQWNDAQGNGYNLLQATAGLRPTFSNTTTLANFNPTVTFQSKWMEFQPGTGINIIDRTNGTLFTAGYLNTLTQGGIFGFDSTMDYPGLHTSNNGLNNLLFFTGGPGYQGVTSNSFQSNYYFSAGANWQNGAGTNAAYAAATVSLNGNRTDYSGSQLQNAILDVNARDIRVGGDTNYGSINGQVNEMLIFENRLSSDEMDRVESYLAIKYGTTYAQGTRDYKNSSSGVVWSTSGNTGYNNNIAGIARDATGLNQKQSWSTNSGKQILISTTGLANTNAANTTSLTAGQYLVWGDNGLTKRSTVAISGISGVNYRFAAIWKAQNTGSVGAVRIAWPATLKNPKLVQSNDAVFDGTDTVTDMSANTQTVNGVTYNYADVTLADGQYFTLASYVQAPGGVVNGLTQWYKAGTAAVNTGDGTDVTSWTDQISSTVSSQLSTAPLPKYKTGAIDYFNFNPGVNFTAIQQMIGNITDPTLNNTNYDIITLTKEGMTGSRFFNIGMDNTTFNGANWDQPGLYADGTVGFRNNAGSGTVYSANPGSVAFDANIPSMMYYTFTDTSLSKGVNGNANGTTATHGAIGLVTGGHIFGANGGYNPPGGDDLGFTGNIGEIAVYGDGSITAAERRRVDSYLAIKYGITLGRVATDNYLSSSGTVIWDGAANSAYNNNIAGIANDDASALNQKQSISVNAGKQLIISTTGFAVNNAANVTSLTNGQYLIWGDNGLQKTPTVAISGISGINYRFASIWKAQNTGSVGTVRVTWPAGLTNLRLIQSSDAVFDNSDTVTNMSTNTQTVNGVTYNYADVTLSNGQYFTFAAFVQAPGGVVGDLRVWLKPDNGFTPSTWQDKSINSNDFTQTNATRQPFVATTLYNFNPVVDFGGTASADGRFMVYPSGGPFTANGLSGTFFSTTLTRTGGTSGYRDIWGFGGTTTTASLPQANTPTITKLNNDIVLFDSTTSAFSGQYPDNQFLLADMSYTVNVAGIKYGLNGATANTTQTRVTGNSLQASGSVLGSQPEVMNGVMGDMIAYERDLTTAEKIKVRTYNGVKYGITLPHDYVASSNQVVWDNAANTTYSNNIFGIANDFVSSLDQKQSTSINSGQKLVVGNGNSLFNTNALNTNTLTDGQFLLVGDNGLKQAPSVALANPAAPGGGINYRFGSIWKVQNTSGVGTVTLAWPATGMENLHLVRSTDATFDATDTFIPMSGTTIINGVTYNTAAVTLGNGQYFTFAAYVHAPGGVLSSLWYRADKGLLPAAGAVTTWTDYSAGQVPVSPVLANTTSAPTSVSGIGLNLNFNPGITFTAANALGNTNVLNALSGGNYTVYTSTTPVTGSGWDRVVGLNYSNLTGGNSYDSPGLGADNVIIRNNTSAAPLFTTVATGYRYNQFTNTTIVRNSFTNTLFTRAFNGAVAEGNVTYASTTTGADGGIIFGRNANNGGDDNGTAMTMAETIVFDGALSVNDVNKVDSYLAIKGGITLDVTNTPNYLSSSSANVWSGSVNTGYNNNIFGIANDFLSALHQKQSKSINDGQKLIIGRGTLTNTNDLNTSSLTDGQFLMVGDNGLRQSLSVSISGITGVNYRFESIWKAQNTGTIGTVRVAWPAGLAAMRLIQSPDAVFDNTDTVTDMSVNTQTVNGVTYNYADVTLANGQFFTFAAFAHAPGGVINGLSQWYRADIDATNTGNGSDVTSWKDYFAGTISAQIAGKALPKYKIGDVTSFNYNPGVSFTAVTQTLGNNTVQTITNTSNDIFTLTKNGITTPGSPNPHIFSITADNATTDASAWDYTGFLPSTVIERRVVGGGTQLPGSGIDYSTTIPSIMYNTFTNTTLARGLNGAANGTTVNTAAMGLALGGHVFGDTRWTGNTSDNGGIVGDIGETIIYGGGNLTAAERRKVDTYMAIKYGITLGRVATDNYISTADGTVWSGSLNITYNNNIFGLAKDDIESLHQKVSKSVNAGTILTMATNNDFVSQNIDASRTALTGDLKYFVAGDNNIAATALSNITVNGSAGQRIQRTWLSQRTNTTGTVYFAADLSTYGASFASGNNVRMIIADDAAFTINVVSVPGVYSGGKWVHSHSFDSENTGRYITYTTLPLDTDNDGIADLYDLDTDNDGIPNVNECNTDLGTVVSWMYNDSTRNATVLSPIASGTASTNGSGLTTVNPDASNTHLRISNIDATTLSQAITNNEYIQYTFTTGNWVASTHNYFYDRTSFLNRLGYPAHNFTVAISENDFVTSGTNLLTDINWPGTVPSADIIFNNAASISMKPNTLYTVRIYFYNVSGGASATIMHDDYKVYLRDYCDTNGDGIPDYLDLDSDNDGCLDAIEGDENVTASMLVTAAPGLSVGTG
ncbi:thrombospondin type 3 repeat-containing protein, partial [Chryseobacterium ginsengisoli]|uniref:beta strand repeat-containing protein n=1 Tax=Chryseobacterium ginsengisoli TaxID=363853 RepID=UPI0031EE3EE5